MKDTEYLRDLSERLMHVPVMYGVDQGDVDHLLKIARNIERLVRVIQSMHAEANARLDHDLGDE